MMRSVKSPKSSYGPVRKGDIKYKDLNGDNIIDSYDQTRIGRGDVPAIVYGFGFNFEWDRKIYLSTFFQGVSQADRLISGDGIVPFSNSIGADRSNLYASSYRSLDGREPQSQRILSPPRLWQRS